MLKLLKRLKKIEYDMGRQKSERNAPRIIDIDILLVGDLVMNENDLQIPHPRMHERYFVLKGLTELIPDFVHPVLNKTIKELADVIASDECHYEGTTACHCEGARPPVFARGKAPKQSQTSEIVSVAAFPRDDKVNKQHYNG